MAAVGAVYTSEPFLRKADDVSEEVMRKKARERRPRPQNKRVRAELLVGKLALFLCVPARLKPILLAEHHRNFRGFSLICTNRARIPSRFALER